MPYYLTRFSYTPEMWKAMAADPHDRREELVPFFEAAGLRIVDMFFEFGEHDGFVLCEGDSIGAAAVSIAAAKSGAVAGVETTVLLTVDEMIEALGKANSLPYPALAEHAVTA